METIAKVIQKRGSNRYLRALSLTIKTTKNFWIPPLFKISDSKRTIVFRNGLRFKLDAQGYRRVRDWFIYLKAQGFSIHHDGQSLCAKRETDNFTFETSYPVSAIQLMGLLLKLVSEGYSYQGKKDSWQLTKNNNQYSIAQLSDNLFKLRHSSGYQLVGPYHLLWTFLLECEAGVYGFDFKDKAVLDIGAYCGESAVFFASHGANKVILYEPFAGHQDYIKNNISLNRINAEVHNEGVSTKDDTLVINYDEADLGFGLKNKGKKQASIKVRNISDVLNKSNADIAKIDCEGAEISLNEVSEDVLRKISLYMIETHNAEIQKLLTKKFEAAGFRHMKEPFCLAEGIGILYLERIPN